MKKLVLIIILSLCFVFFVSCESEEAVSSPPADEAESQALSEQESGTDTTEKEPFKLGRYEFYVDENGKNAVSIYSNDGKTILTTETFDPVTPTPADFESLERGMGVFEVVSRVGLPVGTASFGLITLAFNASDGSRYVIYWMPDMTVDSVVKR